MCDINSPERLRNSLEWIKQIKTRSSINDCVISVFANKCDKLEEQDFLEFDLEKELAKRYPDIAYEEVSVECNINFKDALHRIAIMLL